MDGTFVERLSETQRAPTMIEVDGMQYLCTPSDLGSGQQSWNIQGGHLGWGDDAHFVKAPTPRPLLISTIDGLACYIEENPDGLGEGDGLIVIDGPTKVSLYGRLRAQSAQRPLLVSVQMPESKPFPFDSWMVPEDFVQKIQTHFSDSPDLTSLLEWTSSMEMSAAATLKDDGVTQTVAVKAGVALSSRVPVRASLILHPRGQTFPSIKPQPLPVIFRVSGGDEKSKPLCALFSGAPSEWRAAAVVELVSVITDALSAQAHLRVKVIG